MAHLKSTGNRDTVNEGMQQKSDQCGDAHGSRYAMDFLPKMEMRSERVLSEMDEHISSENDDSTRRSMLRDCFRDKLREGHRDQEARRKSDELVER